MLKVAWTSRAKPGEHACGDGVLVHETDEAILVAVFDGLGHGPTAARATEAASAFVQRHHELPLGDLFRRCDRVIASTRGVAMTIIRVRKTDLNMQHAAVGNVELTSTSPSRIRPITRPGVVGGRFRRVQPISFPLSRGDRLILFTDGISSTFDPHTYARLGTQSAADAIVKDRAKEHDDATCAVLDC